MTPREIFSVVVVCIMAVAIVAKPEIVSTDYEVCWLFGLVAPLGFLIATDPRRLNK